MFELLHAICNGLLVVVDPVVDAAVLDIEKDVEEFLKKHSNYERCYWPSGHEVVFRRDFMTAISEYIEYGAPKTVDLAVFLFACNHLCIRKTDFLEYLKKQRRPLPQFWFSPAERSAFSEITAEKAGDLAKSLTRIEADLNARRDVPVLLHFWFLHDTWTAEQGLMLLSDMSPSTLFSYERNTFDHRIRRVSYMETLDGLERDPGEGHTYEKRLAFYESLWESGDHPGRATPQYFIDWAISKHRPPLWLDWAFEQKLLQYPKSLNDVDEVDESARLRNRVRELENELARVRADSLQGKSRSTALLLIGGFAMIGAELDIHKSRLVGITEVLNDLATKGVNVGEDTLRSYLRDAAKEVERQRDAGK